MPVTIENSIAAIDGNNITLANSGANKLLVIVSVSTRNDYTSPTATVTVGGVTATNYTTVRNQDAMRRLHIDISYILAASYPANGSRAFTCTWSSTVDYTRSVVIECAGAAQTTPLASIVSATGASSGSPYSHSASLAATVGKLAVVFGAFCGNSFTDSGGYINSTDGHTFLKSTMPATDPWPGTRMSVYYDAETSSNPQTMALEYSLRGSTNASHPIEQALTGAFVINEVPAPSITNIDGDNNVNQGQQSVIINMASVPTTVSSWSASIGGNALTTVSWNNNQTATVHIPANLAAGGSQQLSVTYTE